MHDAKEALQHRTDRHEADVLNIFVQWHRNRRAAVRFLRTLLKTQGHIPRRLIIDQLRSYATACRTVMPSVVHVTESVREQSSQGLPPTDASAGAPDAALHVGRPRTTVRVGTRSCAEFLSSRATSTPVEAPPRAPKAGVRRMGYGDVCVLNERGRTTSRRSSALLGARPPGSSLSWTHYRTTLLRKSWFPSRTSEVG